MIGGLFLQFLDRDKLNIELCDTPPDTLLFASDSVQNEIEAGQIICFSAKGSMASLLEQSLYLVAYVEATRFVMQNWKVVSFWYYLGGSQ